MDRNCKELITLQELESNENIRVIRAWARRGFSIKAMAAKIGITPGKFRVWIKESQRLREAIKLGGAVADALIEDFLYTSALKDPYLALRWLQVRRPREYGDHLKYQDFDKEAEYEDLNLQEEILEIQKMDIAEIIKKGEEN